MAVNSSDRVCAANSLHRSINALPDRIHNLVLAAQAMVGSGVMWLSRGSYETTSHCALACVSNRLYLSLSSGFLAMEKPQNSAGAVFNPIGLCLVFGLPGINY